MFRCKSWFSTILFYICQNILFAKIFKKKISLKRCIFVVKTFSIPLLWTILLCFNYNQVSANANECLTWRLCSPRSTLSTPLHPPCGKPVPPDSVQSRTSLRTSRPSSRPCNPAVHFLSFLIQGEQLNMALFFWYLVKNYLSSIRYCTSVNWTSHFFQGTRKTRLF